MSLGDQEVLYLEVAEDYATLAQGALQSTQIKDDAASGRLTIRSTGVQTAIDGFVGLFHRNPHLKVTLRYLTTAEIGRERASEDRVADQPALALWRAVAAGADAADLRRILLRLPLAGATSAFIQERDDEQLRLDLLRRIHWECGQKPLEALREDLEAGLLEFLATHVGEAGSSALGLSAMVLNAVLRTSVLADRDLRVLRRADLLKIIQPLAFTSIKRSDLSALLGGLGNAGSFQPRERILREGFVEPAGAPIAPRDGLVGQILGSAHANQLSIVSGATGIGKTLLARAAARRRGADWHFAEFRDHGPLESQARLRIVRREVLGSAAAIVILDDFDDLEHSEAVNELSALLAVIRRRDGAVFLTCARPPAPSALARLGCDGNAVTSVPYLDLEEVTELIAQSQGNTRWAPLIHAAMSDGHPQMTHAALDHLRTSGWSRAALREVVGGEAPGIAAEKRAVRQRLVTALPASTRSLLMRTSLVRGRFERDLALVIGQIEPTIAEAGNHLDRLIGSWIEPLDGGYLRASPLVAEAGQEMLAPAERRSIHQAITSHYLDGGELDVAHADAILHHALESQEPSVLLTFAAGIITAPDDAIAHLGRHAILLVAQPVDRLLFPSNAFVALNLRLAQLIVAIEAASPEKVQAIWDALLREQEEHGSERSLDAVYAKALTQTYFSRKIADWFDALLILDRLTQSSERLQATARAMEERGTSSIVGFLFSLQAFGLPDIAALHAIIKRLALVEPEVRARLFAFAEERADGLSTFLNGPWTKEVEGGQLDGRKAAKAYLEMAELAARWEYRELALRARVCACVMLDEYADDLGGASAILDQSDALFGLDDVTTRARAKLLWRRTDHAAALAEFERLARHGEASVDRVHMMREAGMAAAALSRWSDARGWFEDARIVAMDLPGEVMQAMAIGLGADAGQLARLQGDRAGAIALYTRALEELAGLDEQEPLQAAHVHRVVRHSLLWLLAHGNTRFSEKEIADLPWGACSLPSPKEAIRSRPLLDLDFAWYLLAQGEQELGLPASLDRNLGERLAHGPILAFEITRPFRTIQSAVLHLDPNRLAEQLVPFASATAYLAENRNVLFQTDFFNAERGEVPLLALDGSETPQVLERVSFTLLGFGIMAALAGRRDCLVVLRDDCRGDEYRSIRPLLRLMAGGESGALSQIEKTAESIALAVGRDPVDPDEALAATIRFLLAARGAEMVAMLARPLETWTKRVWANILDQHSFRLKTPQITKPAIETALGAGGPPMAVLAGIALAATPATNVGIDGVRSMLVELRDGDR